MVGGAGLLRARVSIYTLGAAYILVADLSANPGWLRFWMTDPQWPGIHR